MEKLTIRLPERVLNDLQATAKSQGVTLSSLMRDYVVQGLRIDTLSQSQSEMAAVLETVLRPHVERLAAIGAKSAIAAGTAEWIAVAIAAATQGLDYQTVHVEARKKSVAQLRMRQDQDDDEESYG